ncbi:MAG: phosphatase PAP2 family protein [Faecalibacterium prausnitzii]|nr:phosphatase PAP2 family protein [Faecalibacterium prausnitzii]
MDLTQLRSRCKPHLWYQLYWVIYLVWFFWLDNTITQPKYIIHAPLDDLIPFNEWFVIPYCSWFLLLVAVTALLWWKDTASYDKLCLMMFSGMTFCLIVYMLLPNGLDLRPTVEEIGRSNPAMWVMQLLWKADASVNVCPSIHCQSTACMAIAISESKLAEERPVLRPIALVWAALICLSTVFTKQHSVLDVVCGLAVAVVWLPVLYRDRNR